ncbi:LacI family transcriptional regulator, partial [Candidatus Aerophobetes bacterium]
TLQKNGLEVDKKLIKEGKLIYKDGYKLMKELARKSSDGFTAVFCLNDLVALGAMRAIQEDSKSIPSDYSIIGFDNIALSSISNPPLTTVAQPIKKIAQQAFRTIKNAKEKGSPKKKEHRFWDTKLIARESCKRIN